MDYFSYICSININSLYYVYNPNITIIFFISEGYGAAIIFIIIVIFLIISSVSGEKAIIKETIKNALKEKKEEKDEKMK